MTFVEVLPPELAGPDHPEWFEAPVCAEGDCTRPLFQRGFCCRHYKKRYRAGTLPDPPTVRNRLMARVRKETSGCWIWTGNLSDKGYGRFSLGKWRMGAAHRMVYEEFRGPIPDGLELDHLCRVRSCVNPDHLEPVTNYENVRRGQGPQAHAMRTNRCVHDHEFTPENTIRRVNGARACRACATIRMRKHRALQRGLPWPS